MATSNRSNACCTNSTTACAHSTDPLTLSSGDERRWLLAYEKKTGAAKGSMFDKKVANYIFSRKPPRTAVPSTEFVSGSVKAFARRLRAKPGKHIWMMGG